VNGDFEFRETCLNLRRNSGKGLIINEGIRSVQKEAKKNDVKQRKRQAHLSNQSERSFDPKGLFLQREGSTDVEDRFKTLPGREDRQIWPGSKEMQRMRISFTAGGWRS
jgi:hypothetical protein